MSIIGTFPTTIANGQVEDATVVMSLFAWIQSQTNGNACPATTGSAVLKGDGAGATTAAIPGTDYSAGTQALATGVLKSTTATGALTIASLSDFTSLGLAPLASPAMTGQASLVDTTATPNTFTVSTGQTGTTPRSNPVARFQSTATGRDVNIQLSDNVTSTAEIGMVGGALYLANGGAVKATLTLGGILQVPNGMTTATQGSTDNSTNVATTAYARSICPGVDQTYQFPGKALNTTYTNGTSKGIYVFVTCTGSGSGTFGLNAVVAGNTIASSYSSTTIGAVSIAFSVPAGQSYSVVSVGSSAGPVLQTWAEMRT